MPLAPSAQSDERRRSTRRLFILVLFASAVFCSLLVHTLHMSLNGQGTAEGFVSPLSPPARHMAIFPATTSKLHDTKDRFMNRRYSTEYEETKGLYYKRSHLHHLRKGRRGTVSGSQSGAMTMRSERHPYLVSWCCSRLPEHEGYRASCGPGRGVVLFEK